MTSINVPKLYWALGDPVKLKGPRATLMARPLYHSESGGDQEKKDFVIAGWVLPDFAERVLDALEEST
jgi:hypothetical protein